MDHNNVQDNNDHSLIEKLLTALLATAERTMPDGTPCWCVYPIEDQTKQRVHCLSVRDLVADAKAKIKC